MSLIIDVFEELDRLNEAYVSPYLMGINWGSGKDFWDEAKQNKIDVEAFHRAYDKDLNRLNLLSEFDDDGLVKSKASYGIFKQADQNEWCVKAAIKFCGLQFWNNATIVPDANAKAIKEKEQREKEEIENLILVADSLVDLAKEVCEDGLPAIDKLLDMQAELDFKNKKLSAANSDQDYTTIVKSPLTIEKIDVSSSRDVDSSISIYITFYGNNNKATTTRELWGVDIWISADEVFNKSTNEVNKLIIDKISKSIENDIVSHINDEIERVDKAFDSCVERKEKEKRENDRIELIRQEIIDAVNIGEQPRKEVIDEILKVCHDTISKASKAADFWSDSTDGSMGAAYAGEIYKGCMVLDKYIHDLAWDSDIVSFNNGTQQEYEDALEKLIMSKPTTLVFVK